MEALVTILQMILVIVQNGGDFWTVAETIGVDLRGAAVSGDTRGEYLSWTKGTDCAYEIRVDKKGRTYIAKKYAAHFKWMLKKGHYESVDNGCGEFDLVDVQYAQPKVKIIGGIRQFNLWKANGKKGGYNFGVLVQKPLLSNKTNKFVFPTHWENYWTTEQMLNDGLAIKMGKSSKKRVFLDKAGLQQSHIANAIDILKAFEEISNL